MNDDVSELFPVITLLIYLDLGPVLQRTDLCSLFERCLCDISLSLVTPAHVNTKTWREAKPYHLGSKLMTL